ncbi:MAG: pyridoxal phosphate-dependent aminotransferase [Gammaproteobacteria bacterium]
MPRSSVENRFTKSHKLDSVCYDIRGNVFNTARRMEEEGHRILKLNIGNPAPFGFDAPQEILEDVIHNLPRSTGYCDSKGLFSARKAVMQYYQQKNVKDVSVQDIYLGNGVSELIVLALQALLDIGDEVLIPSPDYPLWTASTALASGRPVHYQCDESADWHPDIEDIKRKITSNTRAIVIINPNNPTGALYSDECLLAILEIARTHNLLVFADEIYDKILYDGHTHTAVAALAEDLTIVSFNGLSKAYRCAGFRSGWLLISGNKHQARGFIEGLDTLSSMRLCANVPSQHAIQTSLGGYQSINDLVLPTGRLCQQRNAAYEALMAIPGISCVKPKAAMYLFPKIDTQYYNILSDEQFVIDLLVAEKILVVHGSGFNVPTQDHFRVVFLPNELTLRDAIGRIGRYLETIKR